MRKILLLFLLLLLLSGCTEPIIEDDVTLQSVIDAVELPTSIIENITLPEQYPINNTSAIALWESSHPSVLSPEGIVVRGYEDVAVQITLTLITTSETLDRVFTITVVGIGLESYIMNVLDLITLPQTTSSSIQLVKTLTYDAMRWTITWSSDNPSVIDTDGNVALVASDQSVQLIASTTYQSVTVTKTFNVLVIALTLEEQVNYVFDHLSLPSSTSQSVTLPTEFEFGLTGVWESSNPQALSNEGIIGDHLNGKTTITLTLILNTNDRRTYEMIVSQYGHLYLDRTFEGTKDNVVLDAGKLVLAPEALIGTYTTDIIETLSFSEAVASWAAISSTQATAELSIRVRVNSVWSKYFSYGIWGLDLQNRSYNDSDAVAQLSADEILIINSQKADALQMKLVLRRSATNVDSASATLIAVALNIPDYTYPVDISALPTSIDYDVPKLYQHIVPTIGGVICSPTSSTMLLKYKGHNFSDKATYEHQYISAVVREYRSGIYGNWVYNTVGISAFGETSYVMRMYSYQELLDHLVNVGPIAASVKGTMIGELVKTWTTSGHLIVIRGYRFEGNQLYILANDPNLSSVYEEYKIENFMNVWRNVAYIVE